MNPFEMVVAIVAITAVASVVRARIATRRRGHEADKDDGTAALRAELTALKERVAVLERLATDRHSSLDREFERLRNGE